jgi:class 3 adenylate cyclase
LPVFRFVVVSESFSSRAGGGPRWRGLKRCRDEGIVDRVGDAFLLVFPEPRAAVMCALEIEQRTAAEPQFPALRGAVHWGDLVYQEGGYVGGSLNVASRVAAQTTPHQIVVTAAARNEVGWVDGAARVLRGRGSPRRRWTSPSSASIGRSGSSAIRRDLGRPAVAPPPRVAAALQCRYDDTD